MGALPPLLSNLNSVGENRQTKSSNYGMDVQTNGQRKIRSDGGQTNGQTKIRYDRTDG